VARVSRPPSDEVALKVENLCYRDALKNVSFELRKGEILGIGGLAGQGQHELLLALAGCYPGVDCLAEADGRRVRLTRPANAIRNSILLVPGDRELEGLFMKHSVFNNMIFPKLGLAHQPVFTPRRKYRAECEVAIELLSIKAHNLDMPVRALSGGNQQKIVVGRWLSFDAKVLLLADPAKGVDVGAKLDLYRYIADQVREKRVSVILYASDIEELVDCCDRILVMYEGQVIATLAGDQLNEETIISTSMKVR
jgi:ribose transport system ATP-binding protein